MQAERPESRNIQLMADISPLKTSQAPVLRKTYTKPVKTDKAPNTAPVTREPSESFELQSPSARSDFKAESLAKAIAEPKLEAPETKPQKPAEPQSNLVSNDKAGGTLTVLDTPTLSATPGEKGVSLVDLFGLDDPKTDSGSAQRMAKAESTYLQRYPYKEGEKADQTRLELSERYHHPKNSTEAFTRQLDDFAASRGVEKKAPEGFDRPLGEVGIDQVKKALSPTVDALFSNGELNNNPDKKEVVSSQVNRFLDLVGEAAPKGLTAADAFKIAQDNTVLVAYQDRAAGEVFMGDHGVRHLLGHNIRVCEELADKAEAKGAKVTPKDRLVMHQAMIMHDLGYAMDTVKNGIQKDGIAGQENGHNVLAARVLRDQTADPKHPLNKLFEKQDLEHIHACMLHHDRDAEGKAGIDLRLTSNPTDQDRRANLETMVRTADNTHAFDDKLPELLLQEPRSLKSLRMIQTATEIGDKKLFGELQDDLKSMIGQRKDLAPDDRKALSTSVGTIDEVAHKFNARRIAGRRPTYEISDSGQITVGVQESPIHRPVSALFGLPAYKQMENFVEDNASREVKLQGGKERIEGDGLNVEFDLGVASKASNRFESQIQDQVLKDRDFTRFALLDAQLSKQQKLVDNPDKIIAKRRQLLQDYRQSQTA